MKFNLTEKQKELARVLVQGERAKEISESFYVVEGQDSDLHISKEDGTWFAVGKGSFGALDALARAELLLQRMDTSISSRICTLTALIYKAVDSNFAEDEIAIPASTLAQPHTPEIAMSLDRLRTKYPDPKKLGFLVMRFTAAKPFGRIVEVIKETASKHGLTVIRADENEFHGELWGNVRTHLHGCGFGIVVYERIETEEPNANVGLEVGYLMAMNKPVLLLKDRTVETIQADLAGKLYKEFDPHDPEGTIPDQLTKWLVDYGIIVPDHARAEQPKS